MISAHLPALQVVIPLVAGPLCLLVQRADRAWLVAMVGCWTAWGIAAKLLWTTQSQGVISYALGGWLAPWGIEYRVDEINAFVLFIVAGISAVVLLYARTSVAREIDEKRIYIFYTGWMLCVAGLLGIVITGDAFNVFVFLEISSLSMYLLISMNAEPRALTAAFRYLVLGTIGATFILIGIALLYMMTGTLNMADLALRLEPVIHTRTIATSFTFIAIGIGIKAAVFPLYFWLPNAYAYAPSAVTALLAGTATKVAIYLLLRFFLTIYGAGFSFAEMHFDLVLIAVGMTAALSMSMVATYQSNIKKLLAYSSVAQIGYMVLGIGLATVNGLMASILHLFNHALIKTALFMCLGCIVYAVGKADMDHVRGLGRAMPLTMAAFVVGGLSLIGIPLTVGFVSKWYLILAALNSGWILIAMLVLLSSLLAVVYVWRVVEAAYFKTPIIDIAGVREAPWSLLGPTWFLIAANIYFGIDTSLTVGVAGEAARELLGVMR